MSWSMSAGIILDIIAISQARKDIRHYWYRKHTCVVRGGVSKYLD